jgi:hypothetical protein
MFKPLVLAIVCKRVNGGIGTIARLWCNLISSPLFSPPSLLREPRMKADPAQRWATVCIASGLISSVAWSKDCDETFTPQTIVDSLAVAEQAFSDLDVDGFRMATDTAAARLPCVRQEISRELSASYHRFVGLRAFVDREQAKAVGAFAAARSIEPEYEFPETFIPSGNPVMNSYQALDVAMDEWETFTPPSEGNIHLNGRRATQRSNRFPSVYQFMDDAGEVLNSAYVFPEQRLPAYPGSGAELLAEPEAPIAVAPVVEEPVKLKSGPHKGLLIGAGVGAIAAGILYGSAAAQASTYRNPATEQARLDSMRKSINSKVVVSAAVATVSVGTGASAFLVAKW